MNLLYKRNTHDGNEEIMQEDVANLILANRLYDGATNVELYIEVPAPQVGRRSDIVLAVGKHKRYHNIECKIVDVKKVLEQAKDHLMWADYSYVCLKHDTYIPTYRIKDMVEYGIGLLLWEPGKIMECVQSTRSKFINKELRKGVIDTINMLTPQNK